MAGRSLGTLTLDLVAKIGAFTEPLDKAGRAAKKSFGEIKKEVADLAPAVGATAAAVAAGMATMTVATIQNANEITRLASLSGTGVEAFQRMAVGAKAMGVEQDALGDILKDVSEKSGEFLATGGGGMADFFEQVAPKIGVTADQFRDLSGADALQLYVSSLEKANLNQAEMTFYLESLASDSSKLLPLLRDNGGALGLLADEAQRAGAIMDAETIRAANELEASMQLAGIGVDGLKNQLTAALLPALSDAAQGVVDLAADSSVATTAGEALVGILKGMSAAAVGVYGSFQVAGKAIGGIGAAWAAQLDGVSASDLLSPFDLADKLKANAAGVAAVRDEISRDIESTVADLAGSLDKVWSAGSGAGGGSDRVKQLADLMDAARKASAGQSHLSAKQSDAAAKAAADQQTAATAAAEAIDRQIQSLQEQAATLGMTSTQQALYKLTADGASASQLAAASAALASVDAYNAQAEAAKKAADKQADINAQAQDIADSLLSEEEQIRKSYERRRQIILDNTQITGEAQAELLRKLEEKQSEELLSASDDYWQQYLEAAEQSLTSFDELAGDVISNFSGQFGDAFEAMVFDAQTLDEAVSGMAESMARSVINALGQMAAQWLAYQLVQMLVGQSAGAAGAGAMASQAQASAMLAGINAYASTAAIPVVGPAAAPGAMAAALAVTEPMAAAVAAAAAAGMVGMAHDGIDSVPQTGTWLLQRGERVTTAQTSAKLDRTLSEIQAARGSESGSGRPVNITVNQPNVTSGREARESSGAAARQLHRAVRRAGRYS